MKIRTLKVIASSLVISAVGNVWGGNLEELSDRVNVSGFASIVGNVSDKEADYLRFAHIDKHADFQRETSLGLQIDVNLGEGVSLTTQLIADEFEDNFSLKADWVYLKYQLSDQINLRAGRLRMPAFVYSDFIEVGYAYPWIRPPSEVYEIIPTNALNGIDLSWKIPVGNSNLIIQPYAGDSTLTSFFGFAGENETDVDEILGLSLRLVTDNHEFSMGSFKGEVDMQDPVFLENLAKVGVPIPFILSQLISRVDLNFYQVGYNGNFGNLNILAEGVRRETKDTPIIQNFDGAYLTVGYHFNDWFPHLTYASIDTRNNATPKQSKNVTLGLRKEIRGGTALKVDYSQMNVDTDIPGNIGLLTEIIPGEDIDKVRVLSVGLEAVF